MSISCDVVDEGEQVITGSPQLVEAVLVEAGVASRCSGWMDIRTTGEFRTKASATRHHGGSDSRVQVLMVGIGADSSRTETLDEDRLLSSHSSRGTP